MQFLKDISGGAEPSKADVKIIEDVMFGQKFNPGVMNVLIDNVMQITDNEITKKSMLKKLPVNGREKNKNR